MAINDLSNLIASMTSGAYRLPFSRASLANQVAGHECSLWRGTGFPAQGAIPAAAAICSNATVGALPLAVRSGAQERIISSASVSVAAVGHGMIIEDRLGHMGGLLGNVATAQTVGLDLHANLAVSNLAQRIGNADYSEVEWYAEWYADTGATSVTPVYSVTYNDGTTGTVNLWVLGATAIPATTRVGRRYKLNSTNGKYIRSVQSVTQPTTGTAGNFGVTAVIRKAVITPSQALAIQVVDWSGLNAPQIFDQSCITWSQLCITTSSGASHGNITQSVN